MTLKERAILRRVRYSQAQSQKSRQRQKEQRRQRYLDNIPVVDGILTSYPKWIGSPDAVNYNDGTCPFDAD